MNGIERSRVWKNLKQRLGLKAMGCCGAMWRFRTQTLTITQQHEDQEQATHHNELQNAAASVAGGGGVSITTTTTVNVNMNMNMNMNLAMALAAERNLRGAGPNEVGVGPIKNYATGSGNGNKTTLMMLIEETDGGDWKMDKHRLPVGDVESGGGGDSTCCCVCMERSKGAAFIPCGHTFCRVCSRDLWLNRGSCPVCNRSIHQILDLF